MELKRLQQVVVRQQAFDHLHTYLNNAIPFSEPTVFCSNTVGINLQNKRNVNILEVLEPPSLTSHCKPSIGTMTDVINSLVITRLFLAYVRQNEMQVKMVKSKSKHFFLSLLKVVCFNIVSTVFLKKQGQFLIFFGSSIINWCRVS